MFFAGLRRFYTEWRFKKAGTDDFRAAIEAAGARDLKPFFEAWIYGTAIPELRFTYEVRQKRQSYDSSTAAKSFPCR